MILAASLSGLAITVPLLLVLICAVGLAIADHRFQRRRTRGIELDLVGREFDCYPKKGSRR